MSVDSQTKLPQLLMLCNVDFDKDLHFQKCIKLNDLFDINYLSLPGEIYIVYTFGGIFQCRLAFVEQVGSVCFENVPVIHLPV